MFKYTEGLIRNDACKNLGLIANNTEEEVHRFVASCVTDMQILSDSEFMKSTNVPVDKKLSEMKKIQNYYKRFEDITMIDTNGRVTTSTTYNYRGDWKAKKWFLEAIQGNVYVSDAHVILDPYKIVVAIAVPLMNGSGKPQAALVGQLNMERLWEIVDKIKIGRTGFVAIANDQKYYVAHPEKERLFQQSPFDLEKQSGFIEHTDHNLKTLIYNTAKYVSKSDYELPAWSIIAAQEKKDALSNVYKLKYSVIYIFIASFSLIIVISIFVSQNIVKPLQNLIQGTKRVAEGDLNYTTHLKSRDEIGLLDASFNDMVVRLSKARQEIQSKTEALQCMFKEISLLNVTLEKKVEERTRELRDKQHQLLQTSKLAAIGQLGAGVAHELNNPIAGILGYAQLMLEIISKEHVKIEDVYVFKKYLQHIENGSLRCKEIIQNLLQFARKSSDEFIPLDVNTVIEATLSLTERQLLSNKITIVKNLTPTVNRVIGNPVQLQQVFTNIIVNAQHAMPEGGNLFITAKNENGNVLVEFKDTGCGIPEEHKDRIFEPFFTTKMNWKGTGLGLSICYDIIKKHNGSIAVSSQSGKGAAFTIILPAENYKNDR